MREPSLEVQISRSSDEEIIAQIERGMTESPDGAVLLRMKNSYPNEYRQFLNGIVPVVRNSGTEEELQNAAYSYGQTYMANFVRERRSTMLHAEPEVISRWVSAQVELLTTLRTVSPEACAQVVEFGSLTPETGQSLQSLISQQLRQSIDIVFDMLESAQRAPQNYEPLTDEELYALGEAALAAGADPTTLAAVGTPQFSVQSASLRCDVGVALYRAISLEPDPRKRARLGVAFLSND